MNHDHDLSPLEACPFCDEPVWLDIVKGEVDWRPCCEAMRAEVERYGFEGAYGMSLRDALIYEVGADPEEVREVFGAGLHDPDDPLDSDYYSDTTHIRYPLEEQVPMQLVQGKRGKPAFSGPQGWQQSVFESVEKYHSHHRAPQGWKFGVAVNNGPQRVGVAVVSNPVSRLLMQQEPDTLEVTRVCVWGHPKLRRNAVSKLYALCAREAKKLGASKLITYTLESEGAGSLIASGWTPVALSGGGAWDRPGRKREGRGKVEEYTSPKVRWEKVLDPRRAVALPRIELPKKAERHLDDPPPQATPAEIAELKDAPVQAEASSSPTRRQNPVDDWIMNPRAANEDALRGRCFTCGKAFVLVSSGLLRKHSYRPDVPGARARTCPGSGQPPVEAFRLSDRPFAGESLAAWLERTGRR
jgi:hypothetical protein